jgi:hypothetical protein
MAGLSETALIASLTWCAESADSTLPSDVRVRHIDSRDPWAVVTFAEPAFVQPLCSPLDAWPKGDVIDRNGMEV